MRHQTLQVATLITLAGGAMLTLCAIALPVSSIRMPGALIGGDAMMLRSAHLLLRRSYTRVMERCEERVAAGEDIDCPDINDPKALRDFMKGNPEEETTDHAAAPELTRADLDDGQRALLRRLERVGACPPTLDDLAPGFLDLCIRIVGPAGENGQMQRLMRGLQTPTQPESSWTLEEYIDAFGGQVRPDR